MNTAPPIPHPQTRPSTLKHTPTARSADDLYPCTLTHSTYFDALERLGLENDENRPRLKTEVLGDRESESQVDDGKGRKLVEFTLHDPENPREWSTLYKSWITLVLGMLALSSSLGSSIIAPAQPAIAEYIGASSEVTVLCISLYILGFAFGPLLWAPISEIWGRRVSMIPAMLCLGLFSIGTATSKNATSVFLTRFFGGLFGSAPVSNVSAALGDIWYSWITTQSRSASD